MTNPTISGPTISAEMETQTGKSATSKTVPNIIHRHGLKGYFAVKKPFISKKNRLKRLEFARLHVNKPDSFWRTILWSDEPKYNIFGSDRHRRVWRKPKEALKTKNLNPTVKHGGGSVLIWGCMSYNGLGNLEFIDGIMTNLCKEISNLPHQNWGFVVNLSSKMTTTPNIRQNLFKNF